eukprot:756026-Hanusia_phi.AAC.1
MALTVTSLSARLTVVSFSKNSTASSTELTCGAFSSPCSNSSYSLTSLRAIKSVRLDQRRGVSGGGVVETGGEERRGEERRVVSLILVERRGKESRAGGDEWRGEGEDQDLSRKRILKHLVRILPVPSPHKSRAARLQLDRSSLEDGITRGVDVLEGLEEVGPEERHTGSKRRAEAEAAGAAGAGAEA